LLPLTREEGGESAGSRIQRNLTLSEKVLKRGKKEKHRCEKGSMFGWKKKKSRLLTRNKDSGDRSFSKRIQIRRNRR